MTVSSGIPARALTMAGYLALKSLSLRDRRWTRPAVLIASARKPSNFSSYNQASPSGNFSVRSTSIGSLKRAAKFRGGIQKPVCPKIALRLLDAVLGLGVGDRLPLHIAWGVEAAALQGDEVIDHIAGAGASGLSGRRTSV